MISLCIVFVYACNVLSSNVFWSFLSIELVGNFGINVVYYCLKVWPQEKWQIGLNQACIVPHGQGTWACLMVV